MNKLTTAARVRIIAALVEGNSINSTVRMTGISKPTILKLIADLGRACAEHHDVTVRGLACKRIQADEIWSFCYARTKNVPAAKKNTFGFGDIWTWTGICADTKLMVSYLVGGRSMDYAEEFMHDLSTRLTNRVQLTTDGYPAYNSAVTEAFGKNVDYAQLVKIYGKDMSGPGRYAPPICLAAEKHEVCGAPAWNHISTSYAERHNLTIRMGMRRFTRLTNGHSKKIENHIHMVAIFMSHYNFCRKHATLKMTPAMAAGIADHVWKIDELVALLG
jgi:IS1 family transposase